MLHVQQTGAINTWRSIKFIHLELPYLNFIFNLGHINKIPIRNEMLSNKTETLPCVNCSFVKALVNGGPADHVIL